MENPFFDKPIINNPYEYPNRHWELDESGQPTQKITETRRRAEFITPIPKPKKRKKSNGQKEIVFDEGKGLSTESQQYDITATINEVRGYVERWRARIARQWMDNCLVCKGGTYPAQLKYKMLADMACEKITRGRGIVEEMIGETPIKAILDPYNPIGSTIHVGFNTSKEDRWETDVRRCHINWVILDSDWEAEFCRVAEKHPRVKAYVKNHNLGLEVPYRYGSEMRKYRPDFIVEVDDGRGDDDLLHLIVEIKGYRREDAKEKKGTMDAYWIPGVNNLGQCGRWAFAEFTSVYEIGTDFEAKVEQKFNEMIDAVPVGAAELEANA